ncbi:uncharacterized protein VDAG_04081 [Verticillium dahliae VdLs.17]|uniref:Uncharacterized protein n=1 Tax=Verticillium dahliae (strain VdLs.17 / ATCC MYA-4575 / FGSC 10137) TaxID=498257 RepID=G2X2N7_VERDV|nr:uncharacterized protein VDAG_04081 [Verticillium dahliae VdLs.17]EGY22643.1 hypothetical protein VDAG_04081 [Verticillium dahliae VdLs.17]KAH6686548.1 hypothetical protein EV126DRAFT_433566 [Verticillium dahliae]
MLEQQAMRDHGGCSMRHSHVHVPTTLTCPWRLAPKLFTMYLPSPGTLPSSRLRLARIVRYAGRLEQSRLHPYRHGDNLNSVTIRPLTTLTTLFIVSGTPAIFCAARIRLL